MDIEALRIFHEVAHVGSFSAVARKRRLQPSSVARAIAVIEEELAERLFQRTTRKLSLTEAGALFLARTEPLVAQFDEAAAEARTLGRGPIGTLRLSVSVAYGLVQVVPLLAEFRQRFPDLTLELLMSDLQVDLVRDGIDLAIRLAPQVEANVIATKLADTRYKVVASPKWLAAHPLDTPAALAEIDVLRMTLPGYRDRWHFRDRHEREVTIAVNGPVLLSNALALREAAVAGLGPALLADWLIDRQLADGLLIDCFPDCRATATDFETGAWAIYPSRSFLPNKVRVTFDFLREKLSSFSHAAAP
ncbi:MAG: LysR family transcriptional regulator [Sphingobium sp.]|nr:LysR family transcriptional regulator [Sphingobium sp.]